MRSLFVVILLFCFFFSAEARRVVYGINGWAYNFGYSLNLYNARLSQVHYVNYEYLRKGSGIYKPYRSVNLGVERSFNNLNQSCFIGFSGGIYSDKFTRRHVYTILCSGIISFNQNEENSYYSFNPEIGINVFQGGSSKNIFPKLQLSYGYRLHDEKYGKKSRDYIVLMAGVNYIF